MEMGQRDVHYEMGERVVRLWDLDPAAFAGQRVVFTRLENGPHHTGMVELVTPLAFYQRERENFRDPVDAHGLES